MRKYNAGLKMGFIGGVIMVFLYIFNMFILVPIFTNGQMLGYTWSTEMIIWVIECFLFYFLAHSSAEQQYQHQVIDDPSEPYAGVQSAAMGATLLTWLIGWLFIGARAVLQDANGYLVMVEPVSLFCALLITGILVISIGAAVGSSVVHKYQNIMNS